MEEWGRDRIADIMHVVGAALPGEGLTDDDVIGVLFDDADEVRVVATPDGDGFAAAVVRIAGGEPRVHLQLLAVEPHAQRQRRATALLDDIEGWAFDDIGAAAVVAGAAAPFYLFAGVDVHATAALCLFEARGYRARGAELNLSFPSSFRAPSPDGVEVRRVLEEHDADATIDFVRARWPNWVAEVERGIEHGACHIAVAASGDELAGFGCHSVNRLGWLGPIGTDPERQRGGVGSALMAAIARDVMAAGFDRVEVSWIGPIGFYAKAAGASVSRVFRSLALPRPPTRGSSA